MNSSVLVDEDTIKSAVSAVGAMEAGRRVGWAKAFAAMARADSAEHDANILRVDVRTLTRFCGRIYGALEETAGRCRTDEIFRGDNHELKSYLPQGALNEGHDAMRRLLGKQADELARIRAEVAIAKGERHALAEKVFTAARHAEIEGLMAEFNIPTKDELLSWLAKYEEHHS